MANSVLFTDTARALNKNFHEIEHFAFGNMLLSLFVYDYHVDESEQEDSRYSLTGTPLRSAPVHFDPWKQYIMSF